MICLCCQKEFDTLYLFEGYKPENKDNWYCKKCYKSENGYNPEKDIKEFLEQLDKE